MSITQYIKQVVLNSETLDPGDWFERDGKLFLNQHLSTGDSLLLISKDDEIWRTRKVFVGPGGTADLYVHPDVLKPPKAVTPSTPTRAAESVSEFETHNAEDPKPARPDEVMRRALADIGRLVFNVPEGEELEVDLWTLVQGVNQLVESEKRLRAALTRLLDADVAGTVSEKAKASQKGQKALQETIFRAQEEAARALKANR